MQACPSASCPDASPWPRRRARPSRWRRRCWTSITRRSSTTTYKQTADSRHTTMLSYSYCLGLIVSVSIILYMVLNMMFTWCI